MNNVLTSAASPQPGLFPAAASVRHTPPRPEKDPPIPGKIDPDLATILSWKRPHGSSAETSFQVWLAKRLAKMGAKHTLKAGNMVVEIPRGDKTPAAVLFSCHIDTVHRLREDEPIKQKLLYDAQFGHIFLDQKDPSAGNCLGADDGVGVWIMLRMIEARVPGAYVFHRGEECGGIGSSAMASQEPAWLKRFKLAVAFDRPNNYEVIITQGGQECASRGFGAVLAEALTAAGGGCLKYEVSTHGGFTDTKNYRRLISECINVGVGYQDQHSKDEFLDYGHAFALMNACLKVDWAALEGKAQRDPSAPEIPRFGGLEPDRAWLDEWEPARPRLAAKAPPRAQKEKRAAVADGGIGRRAASVRRFGAAGERVPGRSRAARRGPVLARPPSRDRSRNFAVVSWHLTHMD